MKKLIPFSLILLFLLSQAAISSYGKEENANKNNKAGVEVEIKTNNGKSESKIEIKQDKNQIKIEEENEEEENENKNREKFLEKKDGKFKIWGPIQSFTNTSISLNGKTITIDQSVTNKFKRVGILKIGMYTKVEGVIITDTYYAEQIVVDNRNKKDLSVTPGVSPTISATISPTITGTITPTISITPEISLTPTVTSTESANIGQPFILGEIIKAVENFLNSLKELSRI